MNMKPNKTLNKIINSFYVIGINELKLQKYNTPNINDEQTFHFIQKMDILNTDADIKKSEYDKLEQRWIKLNTSNYWLRLEYSDNYTDPITDLRIQECDYYLEENLLLPLNLYQNGYRPIKIIKYENLTNIPKINQEEISFPKLNDKYVLIPSYYNSNIPLNIINNKKATVILICRKTIFLPLKDIIIQKKQGQNFISFTMFRYESPYSYKYLPVVLDTYPKNENPNQSVGMFCFPEGIQIKENFNTPKCFSFVLTDEVGERTYCSTLVFVQEVCISLREAFIPSYDPPEKTLYCQKAICILSKYPFYYNCLLFLQEIYNMVGPKISNKIPIERAICTFVDSLYIPSYDKLLRFNINNKDLDFYRIANYGKLWDTNEIYIDTLFRLLSYEQIITAWEGLLLEKKLILICSSKAILFIVANALINLLFPFNWIHVYIPILPEKLKLFIESPVPLIIGISFHIEINELPTDSLILNINKNCFENYKEKIPPLPPKLNKILMTKLNKLKEQYDLDNPHYIEKIIFNSEEAVIYLDPEIALFPKIDTSEIRDAFYNVFIVMFKNYEKYFSWLKQSINLIGTQSVFSKDNFLKEFNSLENNSFLYLFSETSLFSQFVDSFGVEEKNIKSSFIFFIESIKKGKGKKQYFLQNIVPKNVIFSPKIEISDLNGKTFNYPEFPKLDSRLFIRHEIPQNPYKSKFLYVKDEWCYSTEKFKRKDWPRYFLYLIYDIWFTFFGFVLNIYEDNQALLMMDYALRLLEYLTQTLKIYPTRNLFSKIIKSCTRNNLNSYLKQILIMVKNTNKGQSRFNAFFHNDYLNGLYFLSENVGHNSLGASIANSRFLLNTLKSTVITEMKKTNTNIVSKINKIIFMTYNLCENCLMTKGITKSITLDEILSGFIMRKTDDNTSVCSNCLIRFVPKIYFLDKNQENLNLKEINFYSPMELTKKIDEIIKQKGEIFFYKENEWNDVYWNIIFYFQLFDLPICVLYVQNNIEKFEKININLKENIKRKFNKEKRMSKKNFIFGKMNKTTNDVNSNLTLDNSRICNTSNNNNISDISINSVKSGYSFTSNTEMDIWRNYQLQKQNLKKNKKDIKNINNNINNNDDKNEVNLNIKETKGFLSDIINYFNVNSKEKLIKFLDKYDKLESIRQFDYVNMHLKKENEKFEKMQTMKEKKVKIQNELKENPVNMDKNAKKDDKCNVNMRYNYDIKKQQIINNNEIQKDYNNIKKNTEEKIALDNIGNNNNIINNNQLMENKTMKINNINNNNQNLFLKNNKTVKVKTNLDNQYIINSNKTNKIKEIYSPQKNNSNAFYPNNNNQILQSSKTSKTKTFNLNDNNINIIGNNVNMQQEQYNKIMDNNVINYNNNQINNEIYTNVNNLNQNKNNINNYINPQESQTVNYQNKINNLPNERYEIKDNNNILEFNVPNYNNYNKRNIKYTSVIEQQSNYLQQQQNNNTQETNYQKPNTQRIQNFQVEQTRQKYHIHQVPAYKSIFDEE